MNSTKKSAIDATLLPPNQQRIAVHALLGDGPSQRAVLDLTVALAEVGITPVEIFQRAALVALKASLENGRLPAPKHRGGKRQGKDAGRFKAAVSYWREYFLRGKRGANKRATLERRYDNAKYVSDAVTHYGPLAKLAALQELALGDESGPNLLWVREWQAAKDELESITRTHLEYMP